MAIPRATTGGGGGGESGDDEEDQQSPLEMVQSATESVNEQTNDEPSDSGDEYVGDPSEDDDSGYVGKPGGPKARPNGVGSAPQPTGDSEESETDDGISADQRRLMNSTPESREENTELTDDELQEMVSDGELTEAEAERIANAQGGLGPVSDNWREHFADSDTIEISEQQQRFIEEKAAAEENFSEGKYLSALFSAGEATFTANKARIDWLFDNTSGSVQEANKEAAKAALGDPEMSDRELAERMQDAYGSYEDLQNVPSEALREHGGQPGESIAEGSDTVLGGLHDVFVADPTGGVTSMASGVNVTEDDADAEAKTNPWDIIEVAGLGGRAVGRAARGGVNAVRGGSNMAVIDDIASAVRGGSDEVGSVSDDVTIQRGDDITDEVDEFDQQARSVGQDDSYARTMDELNDDLGGRSPRGSADDADVNSVSPGTDTTPGSSSSLADELQDSTGLGRTDDAGSRATENVVQSLRGGSGPSISDDLRSTLDDYIPSASSAGDDAASAGDDTASAGDDTASAGDDAAQGVTGRAARTLGRAARAVEEIIPFGRTGVRMTVGGVGVYAAYDLIKNELGGSSGNPGGPNSEGKYWMQELKTYEFDGDQMASLWVTGRGEDRMGYNITAGKNEAGLTMVVSADADLKQASYVDTDQSGQYLQPTFESIGAAEDAWNQLVQEARTGDESDDRPAGVEGLPGSTSEVFTGSLSPPGAIRQGEAFEVDYSVSLRSGVDSGASRFVLVVLYEGEAFAISETNASLSQDNPSKSGTFSVQQGTMNVAPDDYRLGMVAMGEGEGNVASASMTVKPAESGRKSENGSNWDDPQRVQSLGSGWHIYSQTKVGSNETRFMTVGRSREHGLLFLHEDGRPRSTPFYYPSVQTATEAFQSWAQLAESGDVVGPDEELDRPDPTTVKEATAAYDSSAGRSTLASVTEAAQENPLLVGGAVFGVLLVLAIARSRGWI